MQAQRAEYMDVFCKSGVLIAEINPRITLHFIRATNCRIHVIRLLNRWMPGSNRTYVHR